MFSSNCTRNKELFSVFFLFRGFPQQLNIQICLKLTPHFSSFPWWKTKRQKTKKKLEAHIEKKMATQTTTQTRLSRRVISRRRERDKAEVAERRQNTEWHQRALLMHSACHRIQQQGRISHSSLHKTSPQQQQQQTHKRTRACARRGAVMQPHTAIRTCINICALHV